MKYLLKRITIDPKQCGGRPCIRGMRIRVVDVLELFAAGLTAEEILEEMPDLEREDLQASLTTLHKNWTIPFCSRHDDLDRRSDVTRDRQLDRG